MLVFQAPPVIYWNSNPYAVQFSPDGTRLAVGSGGWYGHGGVSLIDLVSRETRSLRFTWSAMPSDASHGGAPRECLTVSGVCFDDAGRYLAISTWSDRLHKGPTYLYRVHGLALEEVQKFGSDHDEPLDGQTPTGLCFTPGKLHVRHLSRSLDHLFASYDVPDDVASGGAQAWRAHARLAVVGDRLVTGGGGSLKLAVWSPAAGVSEAHKAADGLVFGPAPLRVHPAPVKRVTAVIASPDGRLYTGGLGGEIHAWSQEGDTWRPARALTLGGPKPALAEINWATYRPESVVGLCFLDAQTLCSVDAGGELSFWRDDQLVRQVLLPGAGTPRSIACHPRTPLGPLLAVAIKAGEGSKRRGAVVCLSL